MRSDRPKQRCKVADAGGKYKKADSFVQRVCFILATDTFRYQRIYLQLF